MRFAHERLTDARTGLGLTQEELAAAIGVDVRTYRRYESGAVNRGGFSVRHPSRRRIVTRLAEELGLAADELVVADEPAAPLPAAGGPHRLAPARHFVGRRSLVERLRRWEEARVVALVAIGGAGKTSVAERVAGDAFVWSFYQDPRVDAFLDALAGPGGPRRVERVEEHLGRAPTRLVLDGLEVLQADGAGDRARGELEDPALRRLLRAVAAGLGETRALVTSRFPLLDLEPWTGEGYAQIPLAPLTRDESAELLTRWGVASAAPLAGQLGGHALSVAVVGSYVTQMLDGAVGLEGLSLEEARRDDQLARRLHDVLTDYLGRLRPHEREVLVALSIFPGGARREDLASLPLMADRATTTRALSRLVRLGLVARTGERLTLHPFVGQLARRWRDDAPRLHEAERARLAERLTARPDPAVRGAALLDRYERLLHHTLGAGRTEEAEAIYRRVLGGFGHLGVELGEMTRGSRLTRAFGERAATWLRYDRALFELALGDLGAALATLTGFVRDVRARADADALATGLRTTGYALRLAGRVDEAEAAVTRSIEAGSEMPFHVVRGLALEGALAGDRGELDRAMERFDQARSLGDVPVARRGLWLAELLVRRGELAAAEDEARRNLAVCEARGWPGHVAHAHAVLGRIAARTGRDARAHLSAVEAWTERTGEVEMVLRRHQLAGALGDAEASAQLTALATRLGYALAPLGG